MNAVDSGTATRLVADNDMVAGEDLFADNDTLSRMMCVVKAIVAAAVNDLFAKNERKALLADSIVEVANMRCTVICIQVQHQEQLRRL